MLYQYIYYVYTWSQVLQNIWLNVGSRSKVTLSVFFESSKQLILTEQSYFRVAYRRRLSKLSAVRNVVFFFENHIWKLLSASVFMGICISQTESIVKNRKNQDAYQYEFCAVFPTAYSQFHIIIILPCLKHSLEVCLPTSIKPVQIKTTQWP